MTLEERLSALSEIVADDVREGAQMYDEFAEAAQARGDVAEAARWRAVAAHRWDRARALTADR